MLESGFGMALFWQSQFRRLSTMEPRTACQNVMGTHASTPCTARMGLLGHWGTRALGHWGWGP